MQFGATYGLLILALHPLAVGIWPVSLGAVIFAGAIFAIARHIAEPVLGDAALMFGLIWVIGIIPGIGAWPVGPGLAILITILVVWRQGHLTTWRSWFRIGKLDRLSWALCSLTAIISIAGLLLWQYVFDGSLPPFYAETARSVDPWLAGLGGLIFMVLNGLVEDMVMFGLLLTAVELTLGRAAIALVALVFGIAHFYGVPSGTAGILLAGSWGLILAYLRHRTGGMLATYLAHVVADSTIIIMLLPIALA